MPSPFRAARPLVQRGLALVVLCAAVAAQEPLFTFVQVSDSQPQTSADDQAFVDVLRTIAEAGQPGKLLPRAVDLVLFAGDITWGNTRNEWVAAKLKLDTYLTANDIPFLAVPGNHDVNNSDTALYEEFIADAGVWEVGSAAFTGHNGRARTTFWRGLRFIGVNNSNPGWNTIVAADVASVATRVQEAAAAGENAFVLCHHPHDEKERMPLASVLPNPSLVGYLHGHAGSPHVTKGLAGVVNPIVWDVGSNAIYDDRCLLYFEVFPNQLRAHVVVLDANPTSLPPAVIVPLAHPLVLAAEPSRGFAALSHPGAGSAPTGRAPERKLWYDSGSWWGVLWSEAADAWRIQRLERATQQWVDTGPSVSSTPGRRFDALAGTRSVVLASNLATSPGVLAGGSPGQLSRFTFSEALDRYTLDAGFPVAISDARSPTLVLARDTFDAAWAAWTRAGEVFVAHTLGGDDSQWSAPFSIASGLGAADTVALAASDGWVAALWSDSNAGQLGFARHLDGSLPTVWTTELASSQASLVGVELDLVAADGRAFAAVRAAGGALSLFERSAAGAWNAHALAEPADGLSAPSLVIERAFGLLRLYTTGPTLAGQSALGGGAIYAKVAPLTTLDFPPGRGTPIIQDGTHPSCAFASVARGEVEATSGLAVLASVAQTETYWHAFDALSVRPAAPVAEFTAGPLVGPAPLVVSFQDLSSGAPTYWSFDFGDGTSSGEAEPEHVFAAPGTYTVTLRVANGAGEDLRTRTAYVQVTAPAPVQTFRPVADARVNEASPSSNAGRDVALRVKTQAGSSYQSFLRFDLGTLSGTVSSAKLRLHCTDSSNGGGSVFRIADNTWSETGITWLSRPALPASALATMGGVSAGFWTELELGSSAVASGLVSLAVAGGTTNSAYYSSREGAQPPELVLTFAGAGEPPLVAFTGTPTTGPAPLSVTFADTSSGAPDTWAWDFGDGSSSNLRNPIHTYDLPGVYSVILDASNANGLGSSTRVDYVTVLAPPPVRTFVPIADTLANQASPSRNYGSDLTLRVRQSSSSFQSFLRFDLASLTGTVLSARLRLFCTDPSPSGGRIYAGTNDWTETGLTWTNKPALPASSLVTLGSVTVGTWIDVDVTSAVTGPGQVSFFVAGGNSNTAIYSSRQGANPPQLVVETGTPALPVAAFAATPTSGAVPLTVQFSDQSSSATSWLWDFGDGTSSSARHPVHVYTAQGTYTVSLQATNALGSANAVRTDLITAGAQPPVRTFFPVADARVNEASPGSNAGSDPVLRVRQAAGGSYHTYLRYDLASLTGSVVSARLRLFSSDGSDVAGLVFPTSGAWTEAGITWNNKPGPSGPLVTSQATVATGAWAEFDVTAALSGPGFLDLVIQSSSTNSCYYSSREGASPPELVVTTAGP